MATNAPARIWNALAAHPDAKQALQTIMDAPEAGPSDARAHAIQVARALIAAADLVSIDVVTAWVRAAPPEAPAHADVLAAVLAQATRADAAPLSRSWRRAFYRPTRLRRSACAGGIDDGATLIGGGGQGDDPVVHASAHLPPA